ncbi:hypothetical protein EKH57_06450 [Halorubrum sp. BOL3-1]|uniref:hypothetical protein n=1 Tax=Halorubrum sp. BOL3-1 TaxID=2497325 RepID=UPI001004EF25|nr:hypothetical protein [Halorubrum sp. BOL3-1]QAU12386.1 hypothetical protein EKH57_06450 [Halorubrum sp. BOL3-1]
MKDGSSDGRIGFEVDGRTLGVRDVVEGTRLDLRTDREPALSPAMPELFPLPVDRAVSFEAESVSVAEYSTITVRRLNGDFLAQLDESAEFPRGDYCVEISGVTKALLRVENAEITATGMAGPEPVELSFDRQTTVTVGGRSFHTRPEATVTVPDDPAALTEAVSVLGSSISEFSPERSWPTLRGYPPRIERGDELDVPSPLTVPDTGVEVVVRPTYADIYRLSTLSYYLGARMVTGETPAIRLDNGYEERLPAEGPALERRAEELLRTWFFLDTLARTEGYVPSDRYEYEQVGAELPFYPPNLADSSMSERLMEYSEVDAKTVEPYAPAWATEAVLRPAPEAAELLPHLAHLLAPVRVRGAAEPSAPDAPVALARSPQTDLGPAGSRVEADPVPSPDADPIPPGVSVMTPGAYENRLERDLTARGEVAVAFLFDDPERARSVRELLAGPAAPDGISSWSVSLRPNREEVTEVLSNPALDIAFCGLPVSDRLVESATDPVDLTALPPADSPNAPALSVFENARTVTAAATSVDRGGTAGISLDGTAHSDQIRDLVALLVTGSPVSVAVSLAFDDTRVNARFVGDPAASVATDRGLPFQLLSCRAVEPNSFPILYRSHLSTEILSGMEIRLATENLDSKTALVGAPEREVGQMGGSEIRSLHRERSAVFRLPDNLVFKSDDLTAEDIEAFARKALSEASETEPDAESRRQD